MGSDMIIPVDGKMNQDARACTGLADHITIAAEGAGAFLNAMQAEMLAILTAREGNGGVEPSALIGYIQKHLTVGNRQAQTRRVRS